jgi:hypothetical protein
VQALAACLRLGFGKRFTRTCVCRCLAGVDHTMYCVLLLSAGQREVDLLHPVDPRLRALPVRRMGARLPYPSSACDVTLETMCLLAAPNAANGDSIILTLPCSC